MKYRRQPSTLVGFLCFLGFCYSWWLSNEARWLSSQRLEGSTITTTSVATTFLNSAGKNTLYPGELPGYTGWARPSSTLAGSFEMVRPCSRTTQVDTEWTCRIQCRHKACRRGGSLFFVRAYGLAVLPGRVKDYRNGKYDVTVLPLDEGVYTVEVVLTFSNPPAFDKFPLKKYTEPAYEGYMLPGFPLFVSVVGSESSQSSPRISSNAIAQPICTMADMLESSPTSAIETGRWLVEEKMIYRLFSPSQHSNTVSLEGYRRGENSLGIRMDFHRKECSFVDEATLKDPRTLQTCLRSKPHPKRLWHILFVGDSNLEKQFELFRDVEIFRPWSFLSYISTKDGLRKRLPEVEHFLRELLENDAIEGVQKDYVIIFNSGLHDIVFLCGNGYFGIEPDLARGNARCVDTYHQQIRQFANMIKQFPSVMTVFQTTQAAWPKWGAASGSTWLPNTTQPMPFASDFAAHFNEIARQAMEEFKIPTMDSYWLTLSRPDHREVMPDNKLSDKMAHAEREVYIVLVRQVAMMMLEVFCPMKSAVETKMPVY